MSQTTTQPNRGTDPTRIIAEDNFGQWTAWFTSRPEVRTGGTSAKAAVNQLMEAHGIDPANVSLLYHGIGPKRHEYRIKTARCGDCHGSGRYTGFSTVEDCQTCGGIGYL
ncbi:hypothetical protein [Planctomyces sp. SH-PL14]|uniref:hypothetical protein n=1 Tax=Planctomyces sp. SH-PL14 TaxID=1632864 RepID=UPI00078C47BB|nr:hypothetical protein [Planctomyces sp. SH-PL14]AMV18871.1 hypothetical protein VT03_13355 [Planctomyces sp. SH-PL14]